MAGVETEQQITLKLMVITEQNKVLFAEAGKDFVDVLFSFLTLPLGTIASLVREKSNIEPIEVGSLSSLYQSVENLDNKFLSSHTCKEMLLRPKNSLGVYCKTLKLDTTEPTQYFVCDNLIMCRHESPVLLSTFKNKRCRCGCKMATPISPENSVAFDGFVKSNASFMIMDDLRIVPNSLDTFFDLFKIFGIENMSSVNEMTVTITKNKVLDLLKSCMMSQTTLIKVFLQKSLIQRFENTYFPSIDIDANVSRKINLKIMQRKSNGKILFAQGKEDFADFLFSILTFPLGLVEHLMKACSSMHCVDVLFKSFVNLHEEYWTSKEVKNKLVEPKLAPQLNISNMLFPVYEFTKYFCYTQHTYDYTLKKDTIKFCASYFTSTFREVKSCVGTCTPLDFIDLKSETGNNKGYAKGGTMYMATDDLVVTAMSPTHVISLLTSMNIPFSDLEEKEVSIGIKEGVSILQASLTSKSALTFGLRHLLTEVKETNQSN